ncbi:MAG: FAD-binding oxidoreductase [Bacteroidia bacterium]|nr:FAD-binding oxidoreductase [Bacteroidia bacterium]
MYVPSYWDYDQLFKNIDVCIIGSGIVGLNAALSLKAASPALQITVVDSGFLPYGASTRNAGFACFGSMTELLDDLQQESADQVFERVKLRWQGLQRLRAIIGDHEMEYEPLGGYEVFTPSDEASFELCRNSMNEFNLRMEALTGMKQTYTVADEKIGSMGLGNTKHMICNNGEGQINTGRMMTSLIRKVRAAGITILNGLRIYEIQSNGSGVSLACEDGFTFTAKKVLVANNGFARKLFPEMDVIPARAQVLITEPVEGLKLKGSFHYEKGYYYFRNVGNRILFGGGRNLDFETEKTTEFGLTPLIQNTLDRLLHELIAPGIKLTVAHRWSGIMGLGSSKTTILKKVNRGIFCALRMGGMGVAIGSMIGEQAAQLVLESD